jgi:hypothetical protein
LSKALSYQQELLLKISVPMRPAKITTFDHLRDCISKGAKMSAFLLGFIKFMATPELTRAVATIIARALKTLLLGM